ncbi:hypothetical protein SASPL_125099 [Salvia splendens]|uniref:Uncharacterized protein n=1 Tax=Salvia splendens TaxID=180675 RepID=A0A8X8ZPU2_SALSN|nr:hypothetical protein SASPL_125099 [Salvia splendens]
MSIQSRSANLLLVEETISKAMGDLFSRLDESNQRRDQAVRTCDQTLKELRDDFVALKVQNSELMVDSPIVSVNDLNGSGTCITAPNLLQSTASTAPEILEQRYKSVEECVTCFPAKISNFIGRQTPELKQANSCHYFSNPMVELRSLKQLGKEFRKRNVCGEDEGVLIEEARKEMVMKLRGSSNRYVVPQVINLGNTHTASMNHSDLEDRGKRGFRRPSTKHELTRELAYKITTRSNEDMCNEKEIAETEQGKENAAAIVVIEHLALTRSLALAEVKGAKMLSEETEKEEEFPPEGSYELMSKTQESKRKQNLGALTITKAMSRREFFQPGHHKYLVSFLIRMKGDEGVCISPWHMSLFIRKGCSLNLSLLGSLPLEESNKFFLPSHHRRCIFLWSFGMGASN